MKPFLRALSSGSCSGIRAALCAGAFAVLVAPSVFAQTPRGWAEFAVVSATLGVSDSRLCLGEASGDIGCPSYAPSVTTGGHVSVTGNLSANAFIGDGSGLTGVTAAATDRITSGTTQMMVVSNTGFISITQAATNTGWFDPTRGLVTLGVSATGAISGTRGYFTDTLNVGDGVPSYSPVASFGGMTHIGKWGEEVADLVFWGSSGQSFLTRFRSNAGVSMTTTNGYIRMEPATNFIVGSGKVGIRTTAPAATLQVSGSLIVSNTIGDANPALYVSGTTGRVGIGTMAPSAMLDVSMSYPFGLTLGRFAGRGANNGGGQTTIGLDVDLSGTASLETYGLRVQGVEGGVNNYGIYLDTISGTNAYGIYQADADIVNVLAGDVGIGITAPVTELEVSGTVSATYFVGDGSGLTGVVASAGDRIVSGTSSIVASEDRSITISTAGSDVVTIGENGYVGVGTESPSGEFQIHDSAGSTIQTFVTNAITGGAATDGFRTRVNNTDVSLMNMESGYLALGANNAEYIRIASDGNVGIGTAAPSSTLQVSGSLIVSSTGQDTTPSLFVGTASTTVKLGTMVDFRAGVWPNTYPGDYYTGITPTLHLGGDAVGIGQLFLQDGTYHSSSHIWLDPVNALIYQRTKPAPGEKTVRYVSVGSNAGGILYDRWAYSTTYPEVSYNGGYLAYGVGGGVYEPFFAIGMNTSEVLRITSGTNVGIGVTSPTTKLEVAGTVSATYFVGDGSGLTGVTATGDRIVSGTSSIVASEDRSITISTAGSDVVTIGENGYVGVGTDAPVGVLDVRGRAYFNYNGSNNIGLTYIDQFSNEARIMQYDVTGNLTNYLRTDGSSYLNGGNIGIGTKTPSSTLHLWTDAGGASDSVLSGNNTLLTLSDNGSWSGAEIAFDLAGQAPGQLIYSRSSDTDYPAGWYLAMGGSEVFRANSAFVGQLNGGWVRVGGVNTTYGGLAVKNDGSDVRITTGETVPGDIIFGQEAGGAGIDEIARLDSSQRALGIGTPAPDSSLTVVGDASVTTVTVAASNAGCAGAADHGKIRRNPSTGRMEFCREVP